LLLKAEIVNEQQDVYTRPADDANDVFNRVQPFDQGNFDIPRILQSKSSK